MALDHPDAASALALADRIEGACRWVKVGLELYLGEGNSLVAELKRRGFAIFLDLKLHDIPNTVAGAVRSAARLGVDMLTLHTAGGPAMLSAAAETAAGLQHAPLLLGVTVLTSMDAAQLRATGVPAAPAEQVVRLAAMAAACGLRGFVSSVQEVADLRRRLGPEAVLVTPGIRPEGEAAGDQRRVATPAAAIQAGADFLVVGRPITQAHDPLAAAQAILREMDPALHG